MALAHQGRTQIEIADALDISQAAVSKILRWVDQQAARDLTAQRALTIGRVVRHLDHVTRESLRQYEATKDGVTRQRHIKKSGPDGTTTVTQEVVVEKQGNPRWIEQIRRAQETKAAVTGAAGAISSREAPGPISDASDGHLRSRLTDETLERALADLTGPVKPDSSRPE